MFWEQLWEILTVTSIWELLLIFCAKIIEVSIGTLRSILIVKGYRTVAVLLAIVEITLWVFVASRVITGLASSPMKGLAYALGFAAGVFFGSLLEQKLAFGKLLIQTITSEEKGKEIAIRLRELGCGVTSIEAKGKDENKTILMVYTNRRGSEAIIDAILNIDPTAMIVRNDVSTLGGYMPSGKTLLK
jgi:uncharacterized protein YebE (UPF0316 family)